jgi:hypothetical protein
MNMNLKRFIVLKTTDPQKQYRGVWAGAEIKWKLNGNMAGGRWQVAGWQEEGG